MNFYNKHILNDFSFKKYEFLTLLEMSFIKKKIKNFNKNICILNDKQSLRTINALINCFNILNIKYSKIIEKHDLKKENLKDFSRILGLNYDILFYRCKNDKILKIIAKYSGLIVINLLSNGYHPVQSISDIKVIFNNSYNNKNVFIYIGNINSNVIRSLIILISKINCIIIIISPYKYWNFIFFKKIYSKKKIILSEKIILFKKKYYLYTDVWKSMNDKNIELNSFLKFQINNKLFKLIKIRKICHCLPRLNNSIYDFEITNKVFESMYLNINKQIIEKINTFKNFILINNSLFFKIIFFN